MFHEKKFQGYFYKGEGISSNSNEQQNYAFTKISNPNTLLIYIDGDVILHPNLYKLLDCIDNRDSDNMYTFNQYNRLKGNNVSVGYIDTAMVLIPFNLCKNINENDNNRKNHVYIHEDLCYLTNLLKCF